MLAMSSPPTIASPIGPTATMQTSSVAYSNGTVGLEVLAVEDNTLNLMILRQQLSKLGCRTTTATNGEEAIEQLLLRPFDIVLMDCLMPVMDGFEATRVWRRIEADGLRERTPIVAVTALVLQTDKDECHASGMDEVLAKPLRLASLESAILRWTAKRRS